MMGRRLIAMMGRKCEMMTMQQDATLAYIAKFQVTRWLHLYPFKGMPLNGHLRICVLTTSAMSHQAVLEKMHRSSLTASQYLFLTSPFHKSHITIV